MARLNECSRGLSGLYNDRGFGQRSHSNIRFREEYPVLFRPLALPSLNRHLRNKKKLPSNFLLEFSILSRIYLAVRTLIELLGNSFEGCSIFVPECFICGHLSLRRDPEVTVSRRTEIEFHVIPRSIT